MAGAPRQALIAGARRRILIAAWLTVAGHVKSSGYGILVWSELMRRAAAAGFDGIVNYCEDAGAMNAMVQAGCGMLGLPALRVASFMHLTRPIAPGEGASDAEREGEAATPQALVRAGARVSARAGIARTWSADEAAWQLTRLGAVAVTGASESASAGASGNVPGVLTASVITVADEARTRYLVVDDVLWGDAPAPERVQLARAPAARAGRAGRRALRRAPGARLRRLHPFIAAGFMPSSHTIHAYLTMWCRTLPRAARRVLHGRHLMPASRCN